MRELVATHDSTATPESVWTVLTDLDNATANVPAIQKVERLDDSGGFKVGTSWRETRKIFGKTVTEDMTVTEIDPGRSYTTAAESHGAKYRSTHRVEPIEGGSRITMVFGAEPTGLLAKTFAVTVGRLFDNATRRSSVFGPANPGSTG